MVRFMSPQHFLSHSTRSTFQEKNQRLREVQTSSCVPRRGYARGRLQAGRQPQSRGSGPHTSKTNHLKPAAVPKSEKRVTGGANFPDEEARIYRCCELPRVGAELEPRASDILSQCSAPHHICITLSPSDCPLEWNQGSQGRFCLL